MAGPDDKENEKTENGEKPWWSEMVREVAALGLGTVFMTEEAVRNYVKEKKLPKELIAALIDSVSKKKDEFSSLLGKEVAKWLSKVDLSNEMRRFFESHRVHIDAKVTFEPRPEKEEGKN